MKQVCSQIYEKYLKNIKFKEKRVKGCWVHGLICVWADHLGHGG